MKRFMKAWVQFMNNELNHMTRTQGSQKQRRYAHVQIQSEFKRLEQERKKQRFRLLNFRKKLVGDRLRLKTNLLEKAKEQAKGDAKERASGETNKPVGQQSLPNMQQQVKELTTTLTELQSELKKYEGELVDVEKQLEDTESEYVLLQGLQRQIVDNHITHIRHLTMHTFTLHPETQKTVENVHYLLEHNLPIPKYVQKLYEIMPELFQTEIGELDEATRKLLEEKKLVFLTKPDSLVEYYERKKINQHDKPQLMINEVDQMWQNINKKTHDLLQKHIDTISNISNGKTRFRSLRHFIYESIDVDDEKQFTIEQWALKQDVLLVEQWKKDYSDFEKLTKEAVDNEIYRLRIPLFVTNNPKLEAFWRKRHAEIVEKRKLITETKILPRTEYVNVLEVKVREALQKELPANFKLEGRVQHPKEKNEAYNFVLNIFTKVINQLPEDPEDSVLTMSPQEQFQKLTPEMKKELLGSERITPKRQLGLTLDQLTKLLDLNNKNPSTYTLQFFSRYFGVDSKLLKNVLNYISYPRVDEHGNHAIIRFKEHSK